MAFYLEKGGNLEGVGDPLGIILTLNAQMEHMTDTR
jgi:hypothetical protein